MPLLPAGAGPYVAPYAAFLLLVELQGRLPSVAPAIFLLRIAVPSALIAAFWMRGAYPELRGYRAGIATIGDLAAGLAIAALWVGPYLLWPSLERGDPFDVALLGEERRQRASADGTRRLSEVIRAAAQRAEATAIHATASVTASASRSARASRGVSLGAGGDVNSPPRGALAVARSAGSECAISRTGSLRVRQT